MVASGPAKLQSKLPPSKKSARTASQRRHGYKATSWSDSEEDDDEKEEDDDEQYVLDDPRISLVAGVQDLDSDVESEGPPEDYQSMERVRGVKLSMYKS